MPGRRVLDPRVACIVEWAAPYPRVAEIGAGAGAIARALASHHHTVIATDVSGHAAARLRRDDSFIDVRQGDGFRVLSPDEVDAVVIAGLGGHRIAHILAAPFAWRRIPLILQPSASLDALIATLKAADQGIAMVHLVAYRRHLHPVLLTHPGHTWTPRDDEAAALLRATWHHWLQDPRARRTDADGLRPFPQDLTLPTGATNGGGSRVPNANEI